MEGDFHNLQLNQNSSTSKTVNINPVLPAPSTGPGFNYYHGEMTQPHAVKRKLDVNWNPQYKPNTAALGWMSAGSSTPNYKHQIFEFLKAMNPNSFSSAAINSQDFSKIARQSKEDARLTICYADGVYVYDDICPDKAKAVIDMAKNECPVTAYINSIPKWSNPAGDITDKQQKQQPQIAAPLSSALKVGLESLPQARRASLHRFLLKRRQRLINNRVLYDANKNFYWQGYSS